MFGEIKLIDFTNCEQRKKSFGGSNGDKISIIYNEDAYMLKFPSLAKINKDAMYYSNSIFSEYIGCKIFSSVGIDTQKVILGHFRKNNKTYTTVACKDFTIEDGIQKWEFQDFASLKNTIVDSTRKGYGTELEGVLYTIDTQTDIDPILLKKFFWIFL